jgi:CheY-like chemotaxis protein
LARKILLADDSVTAQNMGRKILADAGYEVIAVNNGSAALKKIAELKPDLVILDVYMPGYSGLEVCQRLKESPETSRIPVLLTVGKLEPFKPEEAQRVRAEGFIVKPFEASELLSTLSKLEDKVVPRAEPSKPGRFARAIAAAEESGRSGRSQPGDENGWKSRIGFPKEKTELEQKVADEAPTSNSVSRALVETSAQKTEKKEEIQQPIAVEPSLDVAALAPAGLPKDVTPEEVAAIAAAAAQMQMVVSAIKGEHKVSTASAAETQISQTANQTSLEPAPDHSKDSIPSPPEVPGNFASAVEMEAKTVPSAESSAENKITESKLDSVASEPAVSEVYHRPKDDATSEEMPDVPVTMAATAESVASASPGGTRWTAVSVALEGSETAISLDQEMQKAYSAFAAAVAAAGVAIPQVESASAVNSFAPPRAAGEPPAAISNAEPASFPGPASVSSPQPESAVSAAITAETASAEIVSVAASGETSPIVALAEPSQAPAPVAESRVQESQLRQESETVTASAVPAAEPAAAEPALETKLDPETIKSTAAAWASWRQTRDTGNGNDAAEPQSREFDRPESASAEKETAARAVAAGAEQILKEASAAKPEGDQNNVASIVDSVLADLRPKLMEEISRKMSEKK